MSACKTLKKGKVLVCSKYMYLCNTFGRLLIKKASSFTLSFSLLKDHRNKKGFLTEIYIWNVDNFFSIRTELRTPIFQCFSIELYFHIACNAKFPYTFFFIPQLRTRRYTVLVLFICPSVTQIFVKDFSGTINSRCFKF